MAYFTYSSPVIPSLPPMGPLPIGDPCVIPPRPIISYNPFPPHPRPFNCPHNCQYSHLHPCCYRHHCLNKPYNSVL